LESIFGSLQIQAQEAGVTASKGSKTGQKRKKKKKMNDQILKTQLLCRGGYFLSRNK
jgi:hypothetical protein